MAVVLALILGWNTLSGIFAPGNDPQLSTQPSTEQPTPSTISPSETYAYDPDAKPTRPTETEPTPTESAPPETEPAPTDPEHYWYVEPSNKISYDEFFSQDLPCSYSSYEHSWYAYRPSKNSYHYYSASLGEAGIQIRSTQKDEDGQQVILYTTPDTQLYSSSGYRMAYSDGTWAYLYKDTQIIRIHLITGQRETVASSDSILSVITTGPDVLYYLSQTQETLVLHQVYLPEMKNTALYQQEATATSLSFCQFATSGQTLGKITWTIINPEIWQRLNEEVTNPDSPYKVFSHNDFTEYWGSIESIYDALWVDEVHETLLIQLQKDSGIPAFLQCTYDLSTGTAKETPGLIDSCWYHGASYERHHHFDPDAPAPEAPVVIHSGAFPAHPYVLPENVPADWLYGTPDYWAPHFTTIAFPYQNSGTSGNVYYGTQSSGYQKVPGITATKIVNANQYAYCITPQNSIIQISHDGTLLNTLYIGIRGKLGHLTLQDGLLYFTDGDHIVCLDISQKNFKIMVSTSHLEMMSVFGDSMTLTLSCGMHSVTYRYTFETGELEQTTDYGGSTDPNPYD